MLAIWEIFIIGAHLSLASYYRGLCTLAKTSRVPVCSQAPEGFRTSPRFSRCPPGLVEAPRRLLAVDRIHAVCSPYVIPNKNLYIPFLRFPMNKQNSKSLSQLTEVTCGTLTFQPLGVGTNKWGTDPAKPLECSDLWSSLAVLGFAFRDAFF